MGDSKMTKFFKSTKGKITIAVLVLLVLAAVVIGSYFIFNNNDKNFNYDFATGMAVKDRVQKAQYLPNIDLLASNAQNVKLTSSTPDKSEYLDDLSFDLKDYQSIVDELASITGTATRSETDILEIKEEIYTVLDMVPAFGKWFQLPRYFEAQHAQDGYNNFYYKLDYDKTSEKISVTRMTWSYTCGIYTSSENKIYSSYYDDDLEQYQIMQANYYYNEDNKEVVECSVVDFAKFNKEFYPIQCQYLANIQDTSTAKIQSVIRKDVETYPDKITNNPGGNIGRELDLDTYREGGVMKKVVQLNYTDSNNVELIKIEQNSNTDYYSDINTTNLAYYLKQADDAIYFVDAWDYYDAENSLDKIELKNMFHLRTDSASKNDIIKSFKNSSYCTRQVMGTEGTSSNTVCSKCYKRINDSGLLVYKCDHNKNQNAVARATRETVCSSTTYQDKTYDLLTWNIAKHLSKFAINIGVSNQTISAHFANMCQQLDDKYAFENNLDNFLTAVSKEFIEEISLSKDVKNLYNTIKNKAINLKVEDLNKSAISTVITLEDFNETTSLLDNILTVDASATVKSSILLEKNAKYSIGLVLYDSASNMNYTLLTNYVVYEGNDLSLTLRGSYDISQFVLKDKRLSANQIINLTLGYVLVKESKVNDAVCSNYENASVSSGTYSAFEDVVDGFNCNYQPTIEKGLLKLKITCIDIEKPQLQLETLNDNQVTLSSGAKVYDLFPLLKVTDNDVIKSITIFYGNEPYENMNDLLKAGINKIVVIDRTGNTSTLTFTIRLV